MLHAYVTDFGLCVRTRAFGMVYDDLPSAHYSGGVAPEMLEGECSKHLSDFSLLPCGGSRLTALSSFLPFRRRSVRRPRSRLELGRAGVRAA